MAKEYNIDDILSEVKKRREENERSLLEKQESTAQETEEQTADEPQEFSVIVEESEKGEDGEDEEKAEDVALEKDEQSVVQEQEAEQSQEAQVEEKVVEHNAQDEDEKDGFVDLNKIEQELMQKSEEAAESGDNPKKEKKKMKKGKKAFVIILCILLAVLIAAGVGGYLYIDEILDRIAPDSSSSEQTEEAWTGMEAGILSFDPIDETDASQISSLKDMIKQWYYNGSPCSASHVLNILLVGEDGYDPDEESRADSAIICSVNIKTRKITLTSVLRDTYAYWETEIGNEQTGQFGKINGAKSSGDIKTYINAVEHLYKIKIDNYVTVDFESFKTIIDALGGVEIEITKAEINEINNDQLTYDGVWIDKTFEGDSGVMKLTGEQALAYCRIRHLDSDNARADRQKKCLNQIFKGLKGVSNITLLKMLNNLTPYIKTDMSRDMLVKVAKYALSEGWMNFDIVMNTVPNSRINERGAGGTYYGAWCWKSDFPQDAYNLQMQLYAQSSITLARTRVDVLKCRETGFFSQGYGPVSATIINNHYGEVTTLPVEETTQQEEN